MEVGNLVVALVILGVMLLFLLIGRELVCWYWKINRAVDLLERIHEQLKKGNGL
jgi:hypothetical protein